MSETRQGGYFCYTCCETITFHGSRVRYNLDGTIHLCRPDDWIAYEKYCEYLKHDKNARWIGWELTGEDFWKWKREVYDVGQHRYNYDSVREQQQRTAKEEARRRAEEEEWYESNGSSYTHPEGGLKQALEIMGLQPDILYSESKDLAALVIKNRFRTLAMKLHPDRVGGDANKFMMMNQAHEYLLQVCGDGLG
jgi:hypothetical protein